MNRSRFVDYGLRPWIEDVIINNKRAFRSHLVQLTAITPDEIDPTTGLESYARCQCSDGHHRINAEFTRESIAEFRNNYPQFSKTKLAKMRWDIFRLDDYCITFDEEGLFLHIRSFKYFAPCFMEGDICVLPNQVKPVPFPITRLEQKLHQIQVEQAERDLQENVYVPTLADSSGEPPYEDSVQNDTYLRPLSDLQEQQDTSSNIDALSGSGAESEVNESQAQKRKLEPRNVLVPFQSSPSPMGSPIRGAASSAPLSLDAVDLLEVLANQVQSKEDDDSSLNVLNHDSDIAIISKEPSPEQQSQSLSLADQGNDGASSAQSRVSGPSPAQTGDDAINISYEEPNISVSNDDDLSRDQSRPPTPWPNKKLKTPTRRIIPEYEATQFPDMSQKGEADEDVVYDESNRGLHVDIDDTFAPATQMPALYSPPPFNASQRFENSDEHKDEDTEKHAAADALLPSAPAHQEMISLDLSRYLAEDPPSDGKQRQEERDVKKDTTEIHVPVEEVDAEKKGQRTKVASTARKRLVEEDSILASGSSEDEEDEEKSSVRTSQRSAESNKRRQSSEQRKAPRRPSPAASDDELLLEEIEESLQMEALDTPTKKEVASPAKKPGVGAGQTVDTSADMFMSSGSKPSQSPAKSRSSSSPFESPPGKQNQVAPAFVAAAPSRNQTSSSAKQIEGSSNIVTITLKKRKRDYEDEDQEENYARVGQKIRGSRKSEEFDIEETGVANDDDFFDLQEPLTAPEPKKRKTADGDAATTAKPAKQPPETRKPAVAEVNDTGVADDDDFFEQTLPPPPKRPKVQDGGASTTAKPQESTKGKETKETAKPKSSGKLDAFFSPRKVVPETPPSKSSKVKLIDVAAEQDVFLDNSQRISSGQVAAAISVNSMAIESVAKAPQAKVRKPWLNANKDTVAQQAAPPPQPRAPLVVQLPAVATRPQKNQVQAEQDDEEEEEEGTRSPDWIATRPRLGSRADTAPKKVIKSEPSRSPRIAYTPKTRSQAEKEENSVAADELSNELPAPAAADAQASTADGQDDDDDDDEMGFKQLKQSTLRPKRRRVVTVDPSELYKLVRK